MRTQLIEIENKPVLATGFIINHDKTFREDHAFLMQYVKVFNYENKQLLTAIDHTWLWCNERAFNILMRLSSTTEKFTLNDIMNFSAIVQKYKRANGSYDWGLTLPSDFPVSLNQQKAIFKGIEKRTKELLRGRDYQEIWKRICVLLVYQTKINKNIDDWRDISKFSKKDALITISGHLSQLEGVLLPIYGQEKLNSEIEKEKLRIKNYLLRKYNFLSFES
jgi:hypothetical protein